MANGTETVGELGIDVVANIEEFERREGKRLAQAAEKVGRAAGQAAGKSFGQGVSKDAGKSGDDLAKSILDGAKRRFQQRTGDAKEALLRGLTDRAAYAKAGDQAADAFNRELLGGIKKLTAQGQLSDSAFRSLSGALRVPAARAGEEATKTIAQKFADLPGLIRGSIAVGILGAFGFIANGIGRIFARVVDNIRDTLQRAGDVASAREAFQATTAARGLDPVAVLSELREGARGTVTDLELMRRTAVALQSEIPATAESLGELVEVSRRLARVQGRDATEAFQRMINGIVKGEQNLLEELGLFTRLEDALKKWEKQTGRNSDALDQNQKIVIFYNAVLAEAREKVAALGDEETHAGERIKQLGTLWGNLRDMTALATAESPRIARFLNDMGEGARNAGAEMEQLGARIGAVIDTIVNAPARIGALAGKAADLPFPFNWIAKGNIALTKAPFQVAGAVGGFEENLRLRQLAIERDLQKLLEAQAAALQKIVELRRKGVAADDERIVRLKAEVDLIRKRRAELQPTPGVTPRVGTGTGTADTPELVARDLSFMRKQLETELEKIEKTIRDTFDLSAERAQVLVAELARIPERIRPAFSGLREDLDPLNASLGVLRERVLAVAQAEAQLTAARAVGDTEGATRAEERLATAKAVLADRARQVAAQLREGGISAELYRDAVGEIEGALERAGIELDDTNKKLATFDDHAAAVLTLGRVMLSLADSTGAVSDETRRAATGILDMVQGLQQLKAASAISGLAGVLGALSGGAAVIGGFAALGLALRGTDGRIEEQERLKEIRENTSALQDTVAALRDLAGEMGPLQSTLQDAIDQAIGGLTRGVLPGQRPPDITTAPAALNLIDFNRARLEGLIARSTGAAREAFEEQLAELDRVEAALLAFVKRFREAVNADLDLREAAAQGYDFELSRRQLAAEHEAEVRDAVLAGLDAATLARIAYVQGIEKEAQALAERRAAEDFNLDLIERNARLTGTREDAIAAASARATLQKNRELEAAQKLVDQGIISQDVFNELARILGEEVVRAAEAAAEAFDQLGENFQEDVAVRSLRAGGDERGADVLAFQQAQQQERERAEDLRARGIISQQQLDDFIALLGLEFQQFLAGLEEAPAIQEALQGSAARERLLPTEVVRAAGAITEVTATTFTDLLRSQLTLHRQYLPSMDRYLAILAGRGAAGVSGDGSGGGGGSPYFPISPPGPPRPPLGGDTSNDFGIEINLTGGVHVTVPPGTDGYSAGLLAGRGFMDEVDQHLSDRYSLQRALTGSARKL